MSEFSIFRPSRRSSGQQVSIFKTLVLRVLVLSALGLNIASVNAVAAGSAGLCSAVFDSGALTNETIPFEWKSAIHKIKTDDYFSFDQKLFFSMMTKADQLTSKERNLILKQLAAGYHHLNKEPNRRKVETLIVKLGRFDLLFESKLKQGLNPIEAYRFVHESIRQLVGGAKAFEVDFLLRVAETAREELRPEDTVYLYGSSVTGRSVVGRSDIDFRYVHPLNPNRSQARFESQIVKAIQDLALPRYELESVDIQAFDITPDKYFDEKAWVELGMPGPFVIEVRHDGIFLNVYTPLEMNLVPPPESRPWQVEYSIQVTGYQRYRLK